MVLVFGGAGGRLGPQDFPDPVGTPLIVAFGCALLPVGALLWHLSNGPVPPQLLRTLAIANAVTAVAAITWRLTATGFSDAGGALVVAAACGLIVLAAAQLKAAGPAPSRPRRASS